VTILAKLIPVQKPSARIEKPEQAIEAVASITAALTAAIF
jgi:hypothetical protein